MRFVKPRPWRRVSSFTPFALLVLAIWTLGTVMTFWTVSILPILAILLPLVFFVWWATAKDKYDLILRQEYRIKRRIEVKLSAFLRKDCTLFVNKQTGCAYRLYAMRMGKQERFFMPLLVCYSLEDEVRVDLHHQAETVNSTEYYFGGRLDSVLRQSNFSNTPPMVDDPRAWRTNEPSTVASPMRKLSTTELERLYQELCAAEVAD